MAERAAHRGSITSCWWSGSSASGLPHSEHSPGQSSRHTGWNGSAGTTASRSTGSRSIRSSSSRQLLVRVLVPHLVVVGVPLGVDEQLLEGPVDLFGDGVQAPHAGAGRRAADRTGDEHPLDDGLQPQVEGEGLPLLDAHDVRAEVARRTDLTRQLGHRPGSPADELGVEHHRGPGVESSHEPWVWSGWFGHATRTQTEGQGYR